jgi:hypothetical protein
MHFVFPAHYFTSLSVIDCDTIIHKVSINIFTVMPKVHLTARVDENLMSKTKTLLTKYPGLKLSKVLEVSLESFFDLPLKKQEDIIANYLLLGLKKPPTKNKSSKNS